MSVDDASDATYFSNSDDGDSPTTYIGSDSDSSAPPADVTDLAVLFPSGVDVDTDTVAVHRAPKRPRTRTRAEQLCKFEAEAHAVTKLLRIRKCCGAKCLTRISQEPLRLIHN